MYCVKCGTQIREGANFCQKCGTKVAVESKNNDSKEMTSQTKNKAKENPVLIEGNLVTFGRYDGKPITWRVLAVQKTKKRALLLSDKVLFVYTFNNSGYNKNTDFMDIREKIGYYASGGYDMLVTDDITWADSDIRSMLNTEFYNIAFTNGEKAQILKTKISTVGQKSNNTYGGNETNDNVFLLSLEEFKKYMYQGKDAVTTNSFNVATSWWLRSPGFDNQCVAIIGSDGHIIMDQLHVSRFGVRPAIYIKLEQ